MQGVLHRFLPTLFFVITTAAGHKNSVQSACWLVGYIYLVLCHVGVLGLLF